MSAENNPTEFMLLFRGQHWDQGLSPEETQQLMDQVIGWFENLKEQGRIKSGQPLGPQGRTVSGKKGQGRTVADGPFAESKEAVGGYLLVRANSMDEAMAIAKSNPTLDYGITIEVRPVLEECPVFQRAGKHAVFATA